MSTPERLEKLVKEITISFCDLENFSVSHRVKALEEIALSLDDKRCEEMAILVRAMADAQLQLYNGGVVVLHYHKRILGRRADDQNPEVEGGKRKSDKKGNSKDKKEG